jgi:opacity protein-like surface antigen
MKTRVVVCLFGCLLGLVGVAKAQSYSRFDVSTNYSYFHSDPSDNPGLGVAGLNGGGLSFGYNAKSWLTAAVEVTGNEADNAVINCVLISDCSADTRRSGTMWTFLSGPRVNFRNSTRFTPYAQVLVGLAHGSNLFDAGPQNVLAMSVGGGLDVRITGRLSVRPVQVEYLKTRFREFYGSRVGQTDLRLSSGLAIHF